MGSDMASSLGMARKQVLVQLDDRMVAALDRRAKRAGVSRSELIRRAVAAHLRDVDLEDADRQLVEAYRRAPEEPTETDALLEVALEAWPEW